MRVGVIIPCSVVGMVGGVGEGFRGPALIGIQQMVDENGDYYSTS